MIKTNSSTTSDHPLIFSGVSTTGTFVNPSERLDQWNQRPRVPKLPRKGEIEKAVYAHIRAVRALGRTRINTADIADALSLSVNEINRAIVRLKKKGVRVL
jgi:hypothetical protein